MDSMYQYGPPMNWIKLKWTKKNWKSSPQWLIFDWHKTEGFTLLNKVTFDYNGLKNGLNVSIWTTNELNKAKMDQKHWKSSPQWAVFDWHKTEGITFLNKVTFDHYRLKNGLNMSIWTTNGLNKAKMDQKYGKSSPGGQILSETRPL